MIVPPKSVPPRPQQPPKIKRSSRTKTTRQIYQKNKPALTLKAVRNKVQELLDSDQLLLMKVFNDATIKAALAEFADDNIERRDRIYTPPDHFVSLCAAGTLQRCWLQTIGDAVEQATQSSATLRSEHQYDELLRSQGEAPLKFIESLTWQTAELAMSRVPEDWLWFGHRVFLSRS